MSVLVRCIHAFVCAYVRADQTIYGYIFENVLNRHTAQKIVVKTSSINKQFHYPGMKTIEIAIEMQLEIDDMHAEMIFTLTSQDTSRSTETSLPNG